jgi:hypothetical protein
MTDLKQHMDMLKSIQETVAAAYASGQRVQCNLNLPTVFIDTGENEYFFQESEAVDLLKEADQIADMYGIWASDALIWLAQGW